MIGSGVYAVTSMLLGTVVMRVLGADKGGVFFFAFSTLGQHVYTVAYFAMRPIQIVDVKGEHSFKDYLSLRLITSAAAFILAIIVGFIYAGASEKTAVIIIIAAYKILDAVCDCYESEYQRNGRLDMTGKSMTFRTFVSVVAFLIVAFTTKNLVLASLAMVIAMAAALIIGCMLPIRGVTDRLNQPDKEESNTEVLKTKSVKDLFSASVWLAAATVLDLYIFSASKYAVDAKLTSAISGYYATIFIPTSIIYLLANFIIRPLLTKLSIMNDEGDEEGFKQTIGKIAGMIGALTALGMVAAILLGPWAMKLILGSSLEGTTIEALRMPLTIIIAGGGCYALACLIYYVLVILKKQKAIFIVYLIGAVIAAVLTNIMTAAFGITGAAMAYLISMILVAGAFLIIYKRSL